MKKKDSSRFRIALCVACLVTGVQAQTVTLQVAKGQALQFSQKLFAAGLRPSAEGSDLAVYSLDTALQKSDSVIIHVSGPATGYSRIGLDSLHGFLNVYLQKTGSRQVSIYRFDPALHEVARIAETDVSRLNNSAMFGGTPFYHGSRVYAVRTVSDTSGKQFYLNCYTLKDAKQNFDYIQSWQYPFERKNISSAQVLAASSKHVLMFAEVGKGPKKGFWLLTVNARTGALLRGTRVSDKDDAAVHHLPVCRQDTLNGYTFLAGEKKGAKKNTTNLYFVRTDSLGEILNRQQFEFPVTEPGRGTSKTPPAFLLAPQSLGADPNSLSIDCDLYSATGIKNCYAYCNTVQLRLSLAAEGIYVAEKTAMRSNPAVEDWLALYDKTRMNGRWCADSSLARSPGSHHRLSFPVRKGFRTDNKTGIWLLQKTETAKGSVTFGKTVREKNRQVVTTVGALSKTLNPQLLALPRNRYLVVCDDREGGLMMQAWSW